MDIPEILALADDIEASESYDQNHFFNLCGTPGCIAGHAVARRGYTMDEDGLLACPPYCTSPDGYDVPIEHMAGVIIGVHGELAARLFDGEPRDGDGDRIVFAGTALTDGPSPQEAAEVLRHLAKTGVVDWGRVA